MWVTEFRVGDVVCAGTTIEPAKPETWPHAGFTTRPVAKVGTLVVPEVDTLTPGETVMYGGGGSVTISASGSVSRDACSECGGDVVVGSTWIVIGWWEVVQCSSACNSKACESYKRAAMARLPLARDLFETDDDVVAYVNLRSENDVSQRRASVMQRCWDRGFAGDSPEWRWYVRAADRAKAMSKVGT